MVLYATVLIYLSLSPTSPHTGTGTVVLIKRWMCSLLHVPAYALLTFLLYRALTGRKELMWSRLLLAGGLALTTGLVMELLQTLVPGRYPDVVDAGLNTLGCTLATVTVPRFHKPVCR